MAAAQHDTFVVDTTESPLSWTAQAEGNEILQAQALEAELNSRHKVQPTTTVRQRYHSAEAPKPAHSTWGMYQTFNQHDLEAEKYKQAVIDAQQNVYRTAWETKSAETSLAQKKAHMTVNTKEIMALRKEAEAVQIHYESAKRTWVRAQKELAQAMALRAQMHTQIQDEEVILRKTFEREAMFAVRSAKQRSTTAWAALLQKVKEEQLEKARRQVLMQGTMKNLADRQAIASEQGIFWSTQSLDHARRVVATAREQSEILRLARLDADQASMKAEAERKELVQKRLQAEAQLESEQALRVIREQQMRNKAEQEASDEAAKLLQELTDANNAKIAKAEKDWENAQIMMRTQQFTILLNIEKKAQMEMERLHEEANDTYQRQQEAIAAEKKKAITEATEKTKKVMAIKEAALKAEVQFAAQQLQIANLKLQKTNDAWKLKIEQAIAEAKRSQDELQRKVQLRLQQGAEAARIQAAAALKAKEMRDKIAKLAMKKAQAAQQAIEIQKKALLRAEEQARKNYQFAEEKEKSQITDQWTKTWNEAFNNYVSKGGEQQAIDDEQAKIDMDKEELSTLDEQLRDLAQEITDEETKLTVSIEDRETSKLEWDIMVEQEILMAVHSEKARIMSETKYKTRATADAQRIQDEALAQARLFAVEMQKIDDTFEATRFGLNAAKKQQKDEQIKDAAKAAILIQAEAKARARVSGEVQYAQQTEFRVAQKALDDAQKERKAYREGVVQVLSDYERALKMHAVKMQQIKDTEALISKDEQEIKEVADRWKKAAVEKATAQALANMNAAETRAREEWEALNIQEKAVAMAEKQVADAKEKADKAKADLEKEGNDNKVSCDISRKENEKRIYEETKIFETGWRHSKSTLEKILFSSKQYDKKCRDSKIQLESSTSDLEAQKKDIEHKNEDIKIDAVALEKLQEKVEETRTKIKSIQFKDGKQADTTLEELLLKEQEMELKEFNDTHDYEIEEEIELSRKLALTREKHQQITADERKSCVYYWASMRAAVIQGRALCMSKKKNTEELYKQIVQLNKCETATGEDLTSLPAKFEWDTKKEWLQCTGITKCPQVSMPILKTQIDHKQTHPIKIKFTLPEEASWYRISIVAPGSKTFEYQSYRQGLINDYEYTLKKHHHNFEHSDEGLLTIESMNYCGSYSQHAKFRVCDQVATKPEFTVPNRSYFAGETMQLSWPEINGHFFKVEYYKHFDMHTFEPKDPVVASDESYENTLNLQVDDLLDLEEHSYILMLRLTSMNPCKIWSEYSQMQAYHKTKTSTGEWVLNYVEDIKKAVLDGGFGWVKDDCAGAITPKAPVFSTKLPTRHRITYPYTHKWEILPGTVKTVFDFKIVGKVQSDEERQVTIMSDETQELELTKELVQDGLPAYGSIDLHVHSESACGESSPPVKMVICDVNVHESPKITESPDFGGAGEQLDFVWTHTPAVEKGHMYKLTWYTKHNERTFGYVGKVSSQTFCKGTQGHDCLVSVDEAILYMGDKDYIMFTLMSVNRCIQVGREGGFVIYRREGDSLRKVPYTIDAENKNKVTFDDGSHVENHDDLKKLLSEVVETSSDIEVETEVVETSSDIDVEPATTSDEEEKEEDSAMEE